MPGRNGRTAAANAATTTTPAYVSRPPLRTTADTIPYTLEGPDGEIVTLAGYKREGCPLDIYLEWLRVEAEAEPGAPTDDDRRDLTNTAYLLKLMLYDAELRRGYLMAVIPGLRDPGYANAVNVIAGQDGQAAEILDELGWWRRRDDDAEEQPDPEAVRAPSSIGGRADSPDSLPATASTRSDATLDQA